MWDPKANVHPATVALWLIQCEIMHNHMAFVSLKRTITQTCCATIYLYYVICHMRGLITKQV